MKLTLSILLLALAQILSAQQSSKIVKTEIDHVTVFLTGARIDRNINADLKSGMTEIVIEGLSQHLDPSSIQLRINPGVRLLSITHENYVDRAKNIDPQIQAVQDSIDQLNLSISQLNSESKALNLKSSMLTANQDIKGSNGVMLENLKSLSNYIFEEQKRIHNRLYSIAQEIQELRTENQVLTSRLQSLNAKDNRNFARIKLLVETENASKMQARIGYLVSRAGWEPVYDIVATGIGSSITLKYMAKAFNNTDIDWNKCKLSMSSADPYLSASVPQLDPWYLNFETYTAYKAKSRSNSSSSYQVMQRDNNTWASQSQMKFKEVLVSEVSANFNIDRPYTIPSNAKPYIIEISETSLKADFSHVAVPKLERSAFLVANVTGWESLDIIEGPANIYFNNEYVGKSTLNTFDFDDTLSISMGRDNSVLIERKELRDFQGKTFIGGHKKVSYKYQIKVKNTHSEPISIKILDQYPISKNSEISVTVDEISKALENEETGILSWDVEIDPSKVSSFEIGYTIKYPKSKKVVTKARMRTISAPSF